MPRPAFARLREPGPPTGCIFSAISRNRPTRGPGEPREFASVQRALACSRRPRLRSQWVEYKAQARARPRLFAPTAFRTPWTDRKAQTRANSWGGLWCDGTASPGSWSNRRAQLRANFWGQPGCHHSSSMGRANCCGGKTCPPSDCIVLSLTGGSRSTESGWFAGIIGSAVRWSGRFRA